LEEQLHYNAVESLILEDGHMSHFENPEALIEGLRSFLSRKL